MKMVFPILNVVLGSTYLVFYSLIASLCLLAYFFRKKIIIIDDKRIKILLSLVFTYMLLICIPFILSLPAGNILKTILVIMLFYGFLDSFNKIKCLKLEEYGFYQIKVAYLIIALGLVVIGYLGLIIGGNFFFDWGKHRSMLLSLHEDPVNPKMPFFNDVKNLGFQSKPLVYYYGMYLPAVYLTKIITSIVTITEMQKLGYILSILFTGWNILGLIISLLLLPYALRNYFPVVRNTGEWNYFFPIMILSSHLFILLKALRYKQFLPGLDLFVQNIQVQFADYSINSSVIVLLLSGPQHIIPSMIGLMILFIYHNKTRFFPLYLWVFFMSVTAPLCLIGFTPFLLLFLVSQRKIKKVYDLLFALRYQVFISIISFIMVFLFYQSKAYPLQIIFNKGILDNLGFSIVFRLIILFLVLVMPALEFIRTKKIPLIIIFSILVIMIIPSLILKVIINDFSTKASIPALLILIMYSAIIVQKMLNSERQKLLRILVLLYILILVHNYLYTTTLGVKNYDRHHYLRGKVNVVKCYVGDPLFQIESKLFSIITNPCQKPS